MVNIPPDLHRNIAESGIQEFIEDTSRVSIEEALAWALDRTFEAPSSAIEMVFHEEGDELQITLGIPHLRTGDIGIWVLKFELLDERASYYGMLDFRRVL